MSDEPRCLEAGSDCQGKVEYHLNPDREDFKTFPRCEHHQSKRLVGHEYDGQQPEEIQG